MDIYISFICVLCWECICKMHYKQCGHGFQGRYVQSLRYIKASAISQNCCQIRLCTVKACLAQQQGRFNDFSICGMLLIKLYRRFGFCKWGANLQKRLLQKRLLCCTVLLPTVKVCMQLLGHIRPSAISQLAAQMHSTNGGSFETFSVSCMLLEETMPYSTWGAGSKEVGFSALL